MSYAITLSPHPDPEVDLARSYISDVALQLGVRGVELQQAWLDPRGPVDATIRLADSRALVWDELAGWRLGGFVSGRQGVRTVLSEPVQLGGGVLAGPHLLAELVRTGQTAAAAPVRALTAVHDGLHDTLRAYGS